MHNHELWQWRKRQCVMKKNNRKDFDEWSGNGFLEVMILGWNLKYENGNSLANRARKTAPGTEKCLCCGPEARWSLAHSKNLKKKSVNHTYSPEKDVLSKTNKLPRASRNNPHEPAAELIQISLNCDYFSEALCQGALDFWPNLSKSNEVLLSNFYMNLEKKCSNNPDF